MVHVINKIERPSKDLIDGFRNLGSATVHEASGRKGYVDCAIKPIAKGVRLCVLPSPSSAIPGQPDASQSSRKSTARDILVASVGGHYEGVTGAD